MRNAISRLKRLEKGLFPPAPIGGVVLETRDGGYLYHGHRYDTLNGISGFILLTPEPCGSIEQWLELTAGYRAPSHFQEGR